MIDYDTYITEFDKRIDVNPNVFRLTPQGFEALCLHFADEVAEGRCHKLEYSKWTQLKKLWKGTYNIVITFALNGDLTVQAVEEKTYTLIPNDGDYGFASFVYNVYDRYTEQKYKNKNSKIIYAENKNNNNGDVKNFKIKADYMPDCDNRKEKENMDTNKMFNFDFGPVNSNNVRLSMYGLAVKNKDGKYVSYNASTDEIMDVDILNFNGNRFLYKMPVAVKDVAVGDIVIHQHLPVFVVNINKDGKTLKVVDPINGEKKEIMLTKSPFGFNFVTKIVNFIADAFNTTGVSADNPFGNMWMLAMMDDNSDVRDLVPLMLMSQLNGLGTGASANPLMMMALMNQSDKMNDMMPLMMMNMMGQGILATPSAQN